MISRFFRFLFSGGRKQEKEKNLAARLSSKKSRFSLSDASSFFFFDTREKKRNAPFGPRQFTHLIWRWFEKVGDLEILRFGLGKTWANWEKVGKK